MSYHGDYVEDFATLDFKFTTRKDTGLPTTLSGTPVLSVYKANGVTQSTAGITLTVDFDSVTGLNHVRIDLSADAFYAIGNDYDIVITTGTVNSISVIGEVVGSFSIENRFDEVDLTKIGGTAQSATDLKDFADAGYDPATNKVQGVVLVDTVTTLTGHTVQTGDSFARLGAPAGASVSADVAVIEAQTDDIGVAGAGLTAVPWNAAWDAEVQSEVDDALVAQKLDHLVAVADADDPVNNSIFAKLVSKAATADWSNFTNTTDSLEAIRDKQTDIEADTAVIGALGAGLTDLGGMSTGMKSEVQVEADAALATYDAPTSAEMDTAHALLATPAQVNTEVSDVLKTDVITLPGQLAPPLTPTFQDVMGWLYKLARNRKSQTSTLWQLFADNETTVDAKATVSDDGTTAIKQEIVAGP